MKTTVVHCHMAEYDVYIARPSKWGNPFSHKVGTLATDLVKDREEAIEKFEEYVLGQPSLLMDLYELQGKVLGCWCKNDKRYVSCHGDVLADLANIVTDFDNKNIKNVTTEMLVKTYKEMKPVLIKARDIDSKKNVEPLF